MIETCATEYRTVANESLRRNGHMNEWAMKGKEDIPQKAIDALLADFINYIGTYQGLDEGFFTHYLTNKR